MIGPKLIRQRACCKRHLSVSSTPPLAFSQRHSSSSLTRCPAASHSATRKPCCCNRCLSTCHGRHLWLHETLVCVGGFLLSVRTLTAGSCFAADGFWLRLFGCAGCRGREYLRGTDTLNSTPATLVLSLPYSRSLSHKVLQKLKNCFACTPSRH